MTAPPGWKTYALDELAGIQGGGTPSRNIGAYFGGGIPWVTPTDLPPIGQVAVLNGTKETLSESGLANSSAKMIPAGSVLFSSRASVGKIAVTRHTCATNQGFANFIPNPERLDQWFLAYMLCRYTPEIVKLAGKTTFIEVPRGKLRAFEVAIPPLDEQRRIVARIKECMERVDEIEHLREEQEAETGLLHDAVIDALVDDSWPTCELAELTTDTRNGWSGKQNGNGREFAMLRLSCVHTKRVDPLEVKTIRIAPEVATEFLIKKDDVLVVRGNGSPHLVGRSAIVDSDSEHVVFNDLLIRLRFGRQVLPSYANLVLHTRRVRDQIQSVAKTAAGIWKINQSGLNRLALPCPELKVQSAFVGKVSIALQHCAELECTVRGTDIWHLREAVLRKAFAGEL